MLKGTDTTVLGSSQMVASTEDNMRWVALGWLICPCSHGCKPVGQKKFQFSNNDTLTMKQAIISLCPKNKYQFDEVSVVTASSGFSTTTFVFQQETNHLDDNNHLSEGFTSAPTVVTSRSKTPTQPRRNGEANNSSFPWTAVVDGSPYRPWFVHETACLVGLML